MPSFVNAATPDVERVLAALAAFLGVELSFDRDGHCVLLFANDIELIVSLAAEGSLISLRSPLCAAEPADRLATALALNYGEVPPGFSLALDRQGGQLLLVTWLSPADMPDNEFVRTTGEMLDLIAPLRSRLSDAVGPEMHDENQSWPVGTTHIRG